MSAKIILIMTDFMERLYERMVSRTANSRLRPCEITRLSLGLVSDELEVQEKQFQKKLGRVSERAREKMGVFAEEMRVSRDRIMATLEAVNEVAVLWEQDGTDRAASFAKSLKKRIDHHKHKTKILQKEYP
jgi:hypothetical protein